MWDKPEEERRALRSAMRQRRAALSQSEQARAAAAVRQRLRAMPPYRDAACVMAYAAVRGELSVWDVIGDILASGHTLAMPRCEGPGRMTARRVTDRAQLVPGTYGVPEPGADCAIVPPGEIGLILVPGTAFDRRMNRIGQGGGYYDRFLVETRALRVGICHDFALLARVPVRSHDAAMDMVVTPSGIWTAQEDDTKRRT